MAVFVVVVPERNVPELLLPVERVLVLRDAAAAADVEAAWR